MCVRAQYTGQPFAGSTQCGHDLLIPAQAWLYQAGQPIPCPSHHAPPAWQSIVTPCWLPTAPPTAKPIVLSCPILASRPPKEAASPPGCPLHTAGRQADKGCMHRHATAEINLQGLPSSLQPYSCTCVNELLRLAQDHTTKGSTTSSQGCFCQSHT